MKGDPRLAAGASGLPDRTDVVVIGLGITGAGVALDAASRGLDVIALDAHDVGFGTSRWSSKLVHGGLRYLASGQVGIAHESAVERGILMETTAPHLIRPLPMLIPLTADIGRGGALLAHAGVVAGDLLRRAARTSRTTLPPPRRVDATAARRLAPVVRADTRGGVLSWDGQLEDDVRLVLAVARTAAAYGAHVRTRARVIEAHGTGVLIRDELTGAEHHLEARAVVNATGVWSADLVEGIALKPSRGSHVVVRAASLPGLRCAVMAPVPGSANQFVFALPQPDGADGLVYIGLTDEEAEGPLPDVPDVPDADVEFLLEMISRALRTPLVRSDVVGVYAGLRPLLDSAGATADLSRRHAVLTSPDGVITVVGGKLTTYRRMAEDAVDRAVAERGLPARACRTTRLPLVGAAPRAELARLGAPSRLVRRFGTEAGRVVDDAVAHGLSRDEAIAPIAPTIPVTLAELVFGITHEGAVDVDDLLDRRTRVGLVPADRALAVPAAEQALSIAR